MDDGLLTRPTFMLIVIVATVFMVKAVLDYLGKRRLTARGGEAERSSPEGPEHTRWRLLSNLKWALICLGFGAAVIVYDSFPDLLSTNGAFGLMFVGAGLGYLCYFLIAWRWMKRDGGNRQ